MELTVVGALAFAATAVSLVMLFARTGPDEASKNLTHWAMKMGIHRVPDWIRAVAINPWTFRVSATIAAALIFLGGVLSARLFISPNNFVPKVCYDGPCSDAPQTPSLQPMVEPRFTDLNWDDALEIERAFLLLPKPCVAKLTAVTNESLNSRNILSAILRINSTCQVVDEQQDQATHPVDVDAPPLQKVTGLVIRWHSDFADGRNMFRAISGFLQARESHAMPPNSPRNLIVIQVGDGYPWKK